MAEGKDLFAVLEERFNLAEELLNKCKKLEAHVEGSHKLQRKIRAEISFLSSLKRKEIPIKASHVQSTNLAHLQGVIKATEQAEQVVSIFRTFHFNLANSTGYKDSASRSCIVDVVASNGTNWIKVVARNPKALHRIWQGQGEYGERDLIDQAKDFIDCSENHVVHFQNPLVSFVFCNGVTKSLATSLTDLGISVQGDVLLDPCDSDSSLANASSIPLPVISQESLAINHANLDVSTMIAYVSAVTNGGASFVFKDGILNYQAVKERKEPLLPKLMTFLEGKELLACESAIADFNKIILTIGGSKEQERASKLLERIKQVYDDPSERALSLKDSASIKIRSKIIFGTGDKLKAVTVTANSAFVRAAYSQGVNFSVFIHDSRALTEAKESVATPILPS